MRRLLVVAVVCLVSGLAQAQKVSNKWLANRLAGYESDLRKLNKDTAAQAGKLRQALSSEFEVALKAAQKKGDQAEAAEITQAMAVIDSGLTVAIPARCSWVHTKGYFQMFGPEWIERTQAGEANVYKQTDRTAEFVELEATSKELKGTVVRLYGDRSTVQKKGQKNFAPQFQGQWALPAYLQ
ncbi:hypothetical protein AYO47_03895 [Planctomyces sp. SCGC AG-212-M04]|nr:hypothetical protein AYO47_03895 [Planctomyces sp. SCGC AG-212-M04]